MRRQTTLAAGLIVGAALLAAAQGEQRQSAVGQSTVGVVQMTTVFEKSQMPQDLERIFGQKKSQIEDEANARKAKMDTLQKELDSGAFAKDSDDYYGRLEKLELAKVSSELWLRKQDRLLGNERKRWFEDIYKKVTQACRDAAQSQGVEILLSDNPVDFEVPDATVLINQILQKKVIYAAPHVDLTLLVIERFDNEYLRLGGAATITLAN